MRTLQAKKHYESNRKWKLAHPEAVREMNKRYRRRHLMGAYGLTVEDYDYMVELQENCCAICGKNKEKILEVDHDHTDGHTRLLLCSACNRGLGYFYDNPEALHAAAEYIRGLRV